MKPVPAKIVRRAAAAVAVVVAIGVAAAAAVATEAIAVAAAENVAAAGTANKRVFCSLSNCGGRCGAAEKLSLLRRICLGSKSLLDPGRT